MTARLRRKHNLVIEVVFQKYCTEKDACWLAEQSLDINRLRGVLITPDQNYLLKLKFKQLTKVLAAEKGRRGK